MSEVKLTLEQVKAFLRNSLHLELDDKTLANRGLHLLNTIIRNYHQVPFQNVTSLVPGQREAPPIEDCVRCVMEEGVGGLCWVMNSVLYLILKAIGYDVYPVLCGVATPDAQNHIVVIAKNVVESGDQFLIEAGFGQPTFNAVPLNFEHETQAYEQSFLSFKYRREGDYIIRMVKYTEDWVPKVFRVEGDWYFAYYLKTEPTDLDVIRDNINRAEYTNEKSIFRMNVRMIKWKEGRAICVKNLELLEEKDGKLGASIKAGSTEELCKVIAQYFPPITREQAKLGVDTISKQNLLSKPNSL